jgi:MerR family transcriptional regulator, copper efflux regulator
MLVGELCKLTGLSKDTIRHYESKGLLRPKLLAAGTRSYRHYDEQSIERLELIRIGAKSGMSLGEMKPILDNLMAGSIPFEGQRQVVRDQLTRIDERITELKAAKKLLKEQFKRIDLREQQQS